MNRKFNPKMDKFRVFFPKLEYVFPFPKKSSKLAIALFADYRKAFDTIRYDILLKKLNELGLSSSFIHLINSYLTDRYRFVQIEGKNLH